MRHLLQTKIMASKIAIHSIASCIQSLMQHTSTELPFCFRCWAQIRMAPTFPRNKPMNTVACEHPMSEGSSEVLGSTEEGVCLSLGRGVVEWSQR